MTTKSEKPVASAQAEPPERAVAIEQWANDNARADLVPGRTSDTPPYELLGGFVHQMRAAGLLAAKPSVYRERWEAFLKE